MAVTDYRKPQSQLIYDLIEETNPGFKAQYALGTLNFSGLTAVTADSSGRDTQITCTGKPGSGVIGRVIVTYRRINLTNLFRSVTLQLNNFVSGSGGLGRASWIAELNSRFGVSLLDADFDSGWQTMSSGSSYNIPVLAASLCYKGALNPIGWTRGKRPMGDMITNANRALVGRVYPNGPDLPAQGAKPVGVFQTYGQDASAIKASLETFSASQAVAAGATSTAIQALLDWLRANTGRGNWSTADSATDGGLGGLTWYKYTIPNNQVPEANTTRYNRCMVFQSVAGSWFSGKIILHYNV